jgi:hypothetical protein
MITTLLDLVIWIRIIDNNITFQSTVGCDWV